MTTIYKADEQAAQFEELRRKVTENKEISAIVSTVNRVQQTCNAFAPLAAHSSVSPRFGEVYYASATKAL